VEEELFPLMGG